MFVNHPTQFENKPVVARIVSPNGEMFNICVQKYVFNRIPSKKSESEYDKFMFMQG